MSQALIDELKRENLCTHFVLPLLRLSKFSFTSSGYVNTFLTSDHKRIAVQITDTLLLSRKLVVHPEFVGVFKDHSNYFLVIFHIPAQWGHDVKLFCKGQYSQFSKRAKEYIIRYSQLAYQRRESSGRVVTDGRLLALEKHQLLRGMWERELFAVTGKELDDPDLYLPDELLSSPGAESFINPKGLTRIRESWL